jgi:CheY-like chemotaxis protein
VPKILLIEDNPLNRDVLGRILESAGYEIVQAADGASGIKAFRNDAPDLVVTDIVMPVKDGIATIREILDESPDTKIIAISGGYRFDGRMDLLEAALFEGASEAIQKPFDADELLEATKRLIA